MEGTSQYKIPAEELVERARGRLTEKIGVITARKGRRRPGYGSGTRAVQVADGDIVYRNFPEWCLFFRQDPVPGRIMRSETVLSCDCIMKESALDPSSRGCRYADCIRKGCDFCRGAYKNIGGYMELRGRFRQVERFWTRHADKFTNGMPIWPRQIEPFSTVPCRKTPRGGILSALTCVTCGTVRRRFRRGATADGSSRDRRRLIRSVRRPPTGGSRTKSRPRRICAACRACRFTRRHAWYAGTSAGITSD